MGVLGGQLEAFHSGVVGGPQGAMGGFAGLREVTVGLIKITQGPKEITRSLKQDTAQKLRKVIWVFGRWLGA